jgi:[ribosomal protein S18]-alanine N-acetyltransferase
MSNAEGSIATIRQFLREDLPAVLALQAKCPQAASWNAQDYLRLAESPAGMILVAEPEAAAPPKLLGFAALHWLLDEAELRNIAVDPAHRRQGLGRALLEESRQRLLASGIKRIYLEVRASNQPALGLYFSMGFRTLSVRKDYYVGPVENAVVLGLDLALLSTRRSTAPNGKHRDSDEPHITQQ